MTFEKLRSKSSVLMVALTAVLVSCASEDTGVALRPDTAVVYRHKFGQGITQINSMNVIDLASDGDDVVMLITYGWRIFTEHPPAVGSDGPSTGSSTTGGGYVIAISRNRGATFTTSPILTADSVSGEPLGVYLHAGRAWMLLRTPGAGTSIPLFAHPLDLDTATVGAASPGQNFSVLVANASTVSFAGDVLAVSVSETDETGTQGYFGFQQLELSTGIFTDDVTSFPALDCSSYLYAQHGGSGWTGYRRCGSLESTPLMCRFDSALGATSPPTPACVPSAQWPSEYGGDPSLAVTAVGLVVVYSRGGQMFAARIENGRVVETPLGAGALALANELTPFRRSPYLRTDFGPLIPIGERLVSIASDGNAFQIAVPSPCADADTCLAGKVRVLPVGEDEYLTAYLAEDRSDADERTVLFRRDKLAAVPVDTSGALPLSPVPGCPTAIPATPLVNACAIAAGCFRALSIQTCLDEWTIARNGPTTAARDAFIASNDCATMQTTYARAAKATAAACTPGCDGTTAVKGCSLDSRPHSVVDCAALGTTCSNTPERGIGCYDTTPSVCDTCDALGRAVSCPGGAHEIADCAAFGQVCSTNQEVARCVEPACTTSPSCIGDHLVTCEWAKDCNSLGLACASREGSNTPQCTTSAPLGTCLPGGCAGDYVLVSLDAETAFVDCPALGYRTCAAPCATAGCEAFGTCVI